MGDKPHLCQPDPNKIHTLYFRQTMHLLAERKRVNSEQGHAEENGGEISSTQE